EDARQRAFGSTSLRAAPRPGQRYPRTCSWAYSPFQTAHLVPAARFLRPGLAPCFTNPRMRVGGAPRVVRVLGEAPGRRAHNAARRAPSEAPCVPCRGTLASRRSTMAILGSRGRASVSLGARRHATAGICLSDPCSELLAARS